MFDSSQSVFSCFSITDRVGSLFSGSPGSFLSSYEFVCSLNSIDVNILVYLERRPFTSGIVSLKYICKKKSRKD